MNRQRLLIFSFLTLVFVGVSLLYFSRVWSDSTTRFRTGLPIPTFILPDELRNPDEIAPSGPPRLPELRSDDPLLAGSATSKLTIVEFGDFQCDFCRDQALALNDALALADPGGQVRVIWRDLPLVTEHPRAMAAAVAGQCAARQGKFKRMHDALFRQAKDLSEGDILSLAKGAGLNTDQFLTCQRDPAITFRIGQDIDTARAHAITSVPMLFVNGQPIVGYVDANTLADIIRKQLGSTLPAS